MSTITITGTVNSHCDMAVAVAVAMATTVTSTDTVTATATETITITVTIIITIAVMMTMTITMMMMTITIAISINITMTMTMTISTTTKTTITITITDSYAKVNNTYHYNYDETNCNTFISYLNANNLYGWAMREYLPMSIFTWCTENTEGIGSAIEVDLECPKKLHNLQNKYPLTPKRLKVDKNMLSKYTQSFDNKPFTERLIPNLHNKENCHLHYTN